MLTILTLWFGQGANAGPSPSAPPAWTIRYEHFVAVDHGDGVTRGTKTTTISITPDEIVTEVEEEGRGEERPRKSRRRDPLAAARRQALAALVAPVLALGNGDYALTPFVPDEGADSESITVESAGRRVLISLGGGRRHPYPPPVVVALYQNVTGRAPPPSPAPR